MKREPIPKLCRQIYILYDREQAVKRIWERECPSIPYHPNPVIIDEIRKKEKKLLDELKRLLSETT